MTDTENSDLKWEFKEMSVGTANSDDEKSDNLLDRHQDIANNGDKVVYKPQKMETSAAGCGNKKSKQSLNHY